MTPFSIVVRRAARHPGANAEAALREPSRMKRTMPMVRPRRAGELAAYLKDPSPGVVLLFEATRFEFAGDEKKKLERGA